MYVYMYVYLMELIYKTILSISLQRPCRHTGPQNRVIRVIQPNSTPSTNPRVTRATRVIRVIRVIMLPG